MNNLHLDQQLIEIIDQKLEKIKNRLIVVGCGITSSHLGDERNLREYILASEVFKYIQRKGYNAIFYLADDSFDSLNDRQLRVAVKKDQKMIDKFSVYCGKPLHLIPDPYECHISYSSHYQNEILKRFHSLDIHPTLFDAYKAYNSGLYDFAKNTIFSKFDEINNFLKNKFPRYKMKKIFWPLCNNCKKIDGTDIVKISDNKITYHCSHCNISETKSVVNIKGKFGWKIDCAIKWNVLNTDFEPFYKAYLDLDVGSYYIAKSLSEKFFGGHYPMIIEYGQTFIEKDLSYNLLQSLPKELVRSLFLKHRRQDLKISQSKVIQVAKEYKIYPNLSYLDYVRSKLPYDLLNQKDFFKPHNELFLKGIEFSERILKINITPKIPTSDTVSVLEKETKQKIMNLFEWTVRIRTKNSISYEGFKKELLSYLTQSSIEKKELFPQIRSMFSHLLGVPLSRYLYYLPKSFFIECLSILDIDKNN